MYEPDKNLSEAFRKAYSSYLRRARLFLFADCLSPKALQSRFSSQAMPYPSLLASTACHLVQSAPNEPRGSFRKTPNIGY